MLDDTLFRFREERRCTSFSGTSDGFDAGGPDDLLSIDICRSAVIHSLHLLICFTLYCVLLNISRGSIREHAEQSLLLLHAAWGIDGLAVWEDDEDGDAEACLATPARYRSSFISDDIIIPSSMA